VLILECRTVGLLQAQVYIALVSITFKVGVKTMLSKWLVSEKILISHEAKSKTKLATSRVQKDVSTPLVTTL